MNNPKTMAAIAALLISLNATAQFKLPINNAFRSDVQKVVADYPHQFHSIRGEVLTTNPQTVEYACLLRPGGAQESTIVAYSSSDKPVYSWQATMLSTEDFYEAEQKYKWLYHQLKGLNVSYVADQYTLRGNYEMPNESISFTTSTLSVQAPPTPLQKLRVEVAMRYEFPDWKVSLLVYEKEKEDVEGSMMD